MTDRKGRALGMPRRRNDGHMEDDGNLKANAKISNVGHWGQKGSTDGSSTTRRPVWGENTEQSPLETSVVVLSVPQP